MKSDFVFALEHASWPALILSDSGMIHRANTAAAAVFGGVTEAGGTAAASIWSAENETTVEVFLARLERSAPDTMVLKLRMKNGQTAAFEAYLSGFTKDGQKCYLAQLFRAKAPGKLAQPPASVPGSSPAPSESGMLESGVAHRQKLECALQLTRTVALDFNNALTTILGHSSLLLNKIEPNHPWRSSLVEIEKSAEKAAEVAADLSAFSRQEKDTHTQIAGNLNEVVRRAVELFQAPGTGAIEWTLQLEPRLYTVAFEEAKLQQAFVKILENAVQALTGEARIAVRTANQDVTEPLREGSVRLSPGHYVCVEFEDAGCGIAPEILPRIFEPFFTTKGPDHRGLGLAWVYGIITNHGGSVGVASPPGRGTTVRLFLPAKKEIVRDRVLRTDDLNGTETILVVDDEALLLTMAEMVLSSFGYRVLTCSSGEKALELFSRNQDQIDLIITDLVMPKMSGRELIEKLRECSPNVRIITSSGYARGLGSGTPENYLQKPFTSLDLLRKIRLTLSGPDQD